MADHRVYGVSIHIPEDMIGGTFANAFRVIPDTGDDLFLDFCSYSESDQRGVVVARIRVHSSFLTDIRDRLSSTMIELVNASVEAFLVKGSGEGALS